MCDAHQRALFLLKSREVHKISQMALNDIIADFTLMTKAVLEDVQRRVQSALVANSISPSDIIGLNDIFEDAELKDPFHSLLTEHLQTKYYREHMGLVVSEIVIKTCSIVYLFLTNKFRSRKKLSLIAGRWLDSIVDLEVE